MAHDVSAPPARPRLLGGRVLRYPRRRAGGGSHLGAGLAGGGPGRCEARGGPGGANCDKFFSHFLVG